MAFVKDLLMDSLKDLVKGGLKEFQCHLEKDHKFISNSEMENADMIKTVDKMVDCFGTEEAVKITVNILRKMKQNDLAKQLEKNHVLPTVLLMSEKVLDEFSPKRFTSSRADYKRLISAMRCSRKAL
ncbi:hypothetical protein QQF64_036455 [Cirrhinus molitorella]|uniref:Pyrin domain-containing protein n=1 Tax=Cirrhinus molitorella TaxID=172907 RepID=A0ABR3NJ07_9TELE